LGADWFPDTVGGLNRYLRSLLETLLEDGMSTRAVVVGPARDAPPQVGVVTPGSLPHRLRGFAAATRALAGDASVVDAHFALYSALPIATGAVRKRRLVVHFHGPWAAEAMAIDNSSRLRDRGRKAIERYVYRRADALVVLSKAFKRVLVEDYGVPPERVEVVPPSIDLERFVPAHRDEARRTLGLPEDAFVALSVRRMVPRMGLEVLLHAWASELGGAREKCVLLLPGDGVHRQHLEDTTRRLGLTEHVRFLGKVSDDRLVGLYQAADVCVLPSLELEGFGLVVLESLACGTPVIASRVGGLPEALNGLEPDLTIPPGDVSALRERLTAAVTHPERLPSRERCREHASLFSRSAMVRSHRGYTSPSGHQDLKSTGLVHDYLLVMRGAERTFAVIADMWPAAPVYTLLYDPQGTRERFAGREVKTSVLQNAMVGQRHFRRLLPLYPLAVRRLPVHRHDLVLSSSSAFAHGVRPHSNATHICYCHSPFRYAWHERERALSESRRMLRPVLDRALDKIKQWDLASARDVTHLVANSAITRDRIRDFWNRDATIVHPPVETDRFQVGTSEDFFLVVTELVRHKQVDLALEACRRAGSPVKVVGTGPELERLRGIYAGQAEFLGRVSDAELGLLYGRARALIVPNIEEFGIAAVEAQAAGRPVVAADGGGTRETVMPGETGVLVPPGQVDGFAEALLYTDFERFSSARICRQASRFSTGAFRERFSAVVRRLTDGAGRPPGNQDPLSGPEGDSLADPSPDRSVTRAG